MLTNDNDFDPRAELLSDAQIAAVWPISVSTIARQRRLGAFPEPVRIGRLIRTRRADVLSYFTPPSARPASRRAEG